MTLLVLTQHNYSATKMFGYLTQDLICALEHGNKFDQTVISSVGLYGNKECENDSSRPKQPVNFPYPENLSLSKLYLP